MTATLTVDPNVRQIRRDDEWVQLSPIEFALIAFLMAHPRVAFTRRQLFRQVWGYDVVPSTDALCTVSVHIRRLRRKLETDPSNPTLIRTVWGSGYYYQPPDDS